MTGSEPRRLQDILKQKISGLADGHDAYCLLDFPAHDNIGDSAIWLGEIEALGAVHGRPPRYVSQLKCPVSEIGRLVGTDDIIYLHGGGNFGDIWLRYQAYREAVIAAYPDRRIVQLPQTIHYGNPDRAMSARRAIAKHPDFHLMVRDRESEAFARENFDCNIVLAPDSAFCLDPEDFPTASPSGIVALFRADKERRTDAAAGHGFFDGIEIADWNVVSPGREKLTKLTRGLLRHASFPFMMPTRLKQYNAMARTLVEIGVMQISAGRVVVTDRLHGHILSSILGKPHVVIDNSYGKIERFIGAWGRDSRTVVVADYAAAHREALKLLEADAAADLVS